MAGKRPSLTFEQIIARTAITPNDCWEWQGALNKDGYPTIRQNNRVCRGARIVWEATTGKALLPGQLVCHKCDNPSCLNPNHLFVGTVKDNSWDMMRKGRGAGPLQQRKLTSAEVLAIRVDSRTQRVIAGDYGISQSSVSLIKRRINCGWIEP
jgi:hypothetical protein